MDTQTLTPGLPQDPNHLPLMAGDSAECVYLSPDEIPNLDHIVTEDDTPVDNLYSAYQQKLLTEPLNTSWAGPGEGRPFLAVSNVGLFYAVAKPGLVPDTLLSLDVEAPADPWPKQNRSYFIWVMGKPPDVAIEIVSNREGGEDARKLRLYAQLGIAYYVIWDPERHLSADPLRVFSLSGNHYAPMAGTVMPGVGLGVMTWKGPFERWTNTWLRWCDASGVLIPTGAERAEREQQRAEQERQRAEQEHERANEEHERANEERQRANEERQRANEERQRADEERQRAERLAAQLRSLGVEPEPGR